MRAFCCRLFGSAAVVGFETAFGLNPWHGWQYRLSDGCAPPPFTEKLATYPVRIRNGVVEVGPHALPPGTPASIHVPR